MAFSPPHRFQKLCTLRTHEPSYSQEDVLFNTDRFPSSMREGDLAQVIPIKAGVSSRDFFKSEGVDEGYASRVLIDDEGVALGPSTLVTENSRAYTFVVRNAPQEIKDKDPNLRVSVLTIYAERLHNRATDFYLVRDRCGFWIQIGYEGRDSAGNGAETRVFVTIADDAKAEREQCVASHVELAFRDEYLSRGDMWRLATSELSGRTVYQNQKILFLNTIKATVKTVYINGRSKKSGYFASDTRPIFRSESARYTLFIQMSREMWEFDTECSGEIMFNKVIHGFLPDLFKKWMSINAHHLVSIILFARLEYEDGHQPPAGGVHDRVLGRSNGYQDFYRVVVSDMASNDWINILDQLKREFRSFLEEISVQMQEVDGTTKPIIAGTLSRAYKGNLLEALNLASSQFSRDYIDRDLVRTGISVIVITAGSGYFEVNYDMLKLTTDALMGTGIGIDLVCLAPMPLHSVPLFAYRNPRILESTVPTQSPSPATSLGDNTPRQSEQFLRRVMSNNYKSPKEPKAGDWSYAIPHWVDVSYWRGEAREDAMQLKRRNSVPEVKLRKPEDATYQPRIRLYDLQMGGLMENEMTSIAIAKLHEHVLHPWHRLRHQISGKPVTKETFDRIGEYEREWMDDYDEYIFRPLHEKRKIEEHARKRAQKSASDSGKLSVEAHRQDVEYPEELLAPHPGSYRPGTGFLEWKIKDKEAETPSMLPHRKQSLTSLASNTTTSTSARTPSRQLLRQISFGGSSSLKPAEPTVSTDMSVAGVVKPATFTKQRETNSAAKKADASTYTQQFRDALSRLNSPSPTPSTPARLNPVAEKSTETSRPIEIGSAAKTARLRIQHGRQSSDEVLPSSLETLRGSHRGGLKRDLNKELIAEDKLGGLAHLRRHIPYLSSSAEAQQMPTTVSLSRALSPWLDLLNPCNPKKEDIQGRTRYSRWQHVFPKALRTDKVKWRSLCYPASVPLTNDYFPTADQLASEYHENFYHLIQNTDNDSAESREHLVRELIGFRLAHGFQLVVGESVSEFLGNKKGDLARVFDKSYMAQDGATVFMSLGNTIHQLLCGADGKVEIRRFQRKPTQDYEPFEGSNAVNYRPLIKTFLDTEYRPRNFTFRNNTREYNWNLIDNFIAGYSEEFSDALRFWRARFVLIPVDIPVRSNALTTVREDTDEEIRLEGIKRLTQLWQRHRVLPEEERLAQSLNKRKDPNPLQIEYQTRNPSEVIASGMVSSLFTDTEPAPAAPIETHTTKSYDLKALSEELQGEHGVNMMDRRWHWRVHNNCFIGTEFTNWILLRFKDIDTREAAVEFGNKLMQEGLFKHVKNEKDFRDGQYFYTMGEEYQIRPESRKAWFGASRTGPRSIPATPVNEKRSLSQYEGSSDTRENGDDEQPPERRKAYISGVMKYDVDPRHKSYRPEIINLHYDRLHNPANCYHIRIDWMNVTSKLIEDAVVNWATTAERYGLKLVEVPIAEACAITDDHPFRSPYIIKLAVAPPSVLVTKHFDSNSFTPIKKTEKYAYHKALLAKLHFVLDVEAASEFPSDVDVFYSWGKPDYKYTQYIHKSGTLLVQITDDGNFLLVANRLYSDRGSSRRETARLNVERELDRRAQGGSRRSPMASPAMKPITEGVKAGYTTTLEKSKSLTAEEVKDEMEAVCSDADWLRKFYKEVDNTANVAASPQVLTGLTELSLPSKSRLALS
ncbi:uncharacterized protein PV09_09080 [Verruconis gallopava]|uniref:Vacuolar membrane-associated protein IML1 n=1 Tax=Verruconis gallopava TaxID=253628 RepID=A0A0D1YEQ0_9PEZI|nr:uncharacterized protein PV09_09080 [Verruconis gallopava]KIV99216.1 hypothetical protein PV09_09080 [Verruconis gallopava]